MLAAVATSCATGDSSRPASSDDTRPLELLVPTVPESLDPRYAFDAMSLRATRLLHAGLAKLDERTLEPVPNLAASWTWTAPSELTVRLRAGAHFHGGRPLRADDVVATIRWMQTPIHAGRTTHAADEIADVLAPDDTTIVIRYRRTRASALADLEFPILRSDQLDSPPDRDGKLDGLGPFSAVRIAEDAFELTHASGPPTSRKIRLRAVHNETARAMRLFSGQADMAINALSPPLLPGENNPSQLQVVTREGANVTYLLLNHDSDALRERDARVAVAETIAPDEVIRSVLGGRATAAKTLLSPAHWAYSAPESEHRHTAVRLALPGHLTLLTSADRVRVAACRLLAAQLERRGISVEIVSLEFGTLLARLASGRFDMAMLQIPELAEPGVLRPFLHSDSVPPVGANRSRIRDAELDTLLDAADMAVVPAERRRLIQRIEARVRSEAHLIPLWHDEQIAVVGPRAVGFTPSADGRWLSLANLQ